MVWSDAVKEAFKDGRVDYAEGLPVSAVPYLRGSEEAEAWVEGWKRADADDDGATLVGNAGLLAKTDFEA